MTCSEFLNLTFEKAYKLGEAVAYHSNRQQKSLLRQFYNAYGLQNSDFTPSLQTTPERKNDELFSLLFFKCNDAHYQLLSLV